VSKTIKDDEQERHIYEEMESMGTRRHPTIGDCRRYDHLRRKCVYGVLVEAFPVKQLN
jgi:hypothetical protein